MHYSNNQNPYDVGCLNNWAQICIGPRQARIEEKLFEMKPQVNNLTREEGPSACCSAVWGQKRRAIIEDAGEGEEIRRSHMEKVEGQAQI